MKLLDHSSWRKRYELKLYVCRKKTSIIHCSRYSWGAWRWEHDLSRRPNTPAIVSWCLTAVFSNEGMNVDDLLSIPTIAWFNPTLLFVAGLLEGRGVRHEASNTLTELWQEIGRSCLAIPAAALVATCYLFAPVALTDGNVGKTWCICWASWCLFKCVTRTRTVIREESTSWSGSYLICYIFIFRDLRCQFICHTLITNRVWSLLLTN